MSPSLLPPEGSPPSLPPAITDRRKLARFEVFGTLETQAPSPGQHPASAGRTELCLSSHSRSSSVDPPVPSSELVLDSTCQGLPAVVPSSYPHLPLCHSPWCPKAVKGCHQSAKSGRRTGLGRLSCDPLPPRGSVYLGQEEAMISEQLSQSPVSSAHRDGSKIFRSGSAVSKVVRNQHENFDFK